MCNSLRNEADATLQTDCLESYSEQMQAVQKQSQGLLCRPVHQIMFHTYDETEDSHRVLRTEMWR